MATTSVARSPNLSQLRNEFLEVKAHPTWDYGVFARKFIPAGTEILKEAPLAVSLYDSDFEQTLTYEILTPPSKAKFNNLYEFCCPNVCSTTKVQSIWKNNSFTLCCHRNISGNISVLFNIASYFNHECLPNAVRSIKIQGHNGHIIVTTARDIEAGREVTMSYIELPERRNTAKERLEWIQTDWRFTCTCELCSSDADLTRDTVIEWLGDLRRTPPNDERMDVDDVPSNAVEFQNPRSPEDLLRADKLTDILERIMERLDSEAYVEILSEIEADAEGWLKAGPIARRKFVGSIEGEIHTAFPSMVPEQFFLALRHKSLEKENLLFQKAIETNEEAAGEYVDLLSELYFE